MGNRQCSTPYLVFSICRQPVFPESPKSFADRCSRLLKRDRLSGNSILFGGFLISTVANTRYTAHWECLWFKGEEKHRFRRMFRHGSLLPRCAENWSHKRLPGSGLRGPALRWVSHGSSLRLKDL